MYQTSVEVETVRIVGNINFIMLCLFCVISCLAWSLKCFLRATSGDSAGALVALAVTGHKCAVVLSGSF